MIKKIAKISNLGTFKDFTWLRNCNEFKRYNFFYGWNYSGKTTLSRIFKFLEDKRLNPDFESVSFILKTESDEITEINIGQDFNIRVFNEDFIEENFRWNDDKHEINPVLLLSKESIELEDTVNNLIKEKDEQEKHLKEIVKKKQSHEKHKDQFLTDKASNMRSILGITNPKEFDKNELEEKINGIRDNYRNLILQDEEYNQLLTTIRISTHYEMLPTISMQLKLNKYFNEVENILTKKITVQQVIEKLKDNPKLSTWVWEGINLHKNEATCQFCGNRLPEDLLERLNKHFSDEFEQLINQIDRQEKQINNHKNDIERFQTPDKARFFPGYQKEYEEKLRVLLSELKNYTYSLEGLLNKLKEKREKPFDALVLEDINSNQTSIENLINEINKIIADNNQKVENLEKEKSQAKEKIKNHHAAKAVDEIKYFARVRLLDCYNKKIKQLKNKKNEIERKINEINSQIKSGALGAEKINYYLTQFFNDDKLKLKLLDNGKYQIYRDIEIAKNLSTGEKNIIALIYFFVRLEEKDFNLSESIVFIDDPVSSLDSNHTFKVYGFLAEKILNCKQLFITTHKFDFFNLLKDLVKSDPDGTPNKQNKRDKENYYLIKKITSNNDKFTIIENLPDVLRKFKSEYNYLFSILKQYNESKDKSNFELLYILPNIARRFLEAYLFQKYPDGKKFKDKCGKYFADIDLKEKQTTLKILDEYSHEENPEHLQKFPDINEMETCVKCVLETIEKKDKEHYDALCESNRN